MFFCVCVSRVCLRVGWLAMPSVPSAATPPTHLPPFPLITRVGLTICVPVCSHSEKGSVCVRVCVCVCVCERGGFRAVVLVTGVATKSTRTQRQVHNIRCSCAQTTTMKAQVMSRNVRQMISLYSNKCRSILCAAYATGVFLWHHAVRSCGRRHYVFRLSVHPSRSREHDIARMPGGKSGTNVYLESRMKVSGGGQGHCGLI